MYVKYVCYDILEENNQLNMLNIRTYQNVSTISEVIEGVMEEHLLGY